MQLVDIRAGETLMIGDRPVACLWARGGKARLVTPSVPDESLEDLRRYVQRERREGSGAISDKPIDDARL